MAHNLSFEKIRVDWKEVNSSFAHGDILGYNLTLQDARNVSFRRNNVENASASFTIFDGLKEFTMYSIGVLAYNKFGDGPDHVVYGKTKMLRKYLSYYKGRV